MNQGQFTGHSFAELRFDLNVLHLNLKSDSKVTLCATPPVPKIYCTITHFDEIFRAVNDNHP